MVDDYMDLISGTGKNPLEIDCGVIMSVLEYLLILFLPLSFRQY